MLSTTFWDPAFANANGNILAATLGGRDNTVHSLAIGDSIVLSNTMVNNIRFSVSRTSVVRTHSTFGPEDVGVRMFSYIPDYMNLTVTGAFSINTGTETFSFYKPNTYSLSDDLTMVKGITSSGSAASWRCPTGRRNRTCARWARCRSTAA